MVPTNEAGGWGLWEEKPGIYLKMAMSLEHPLGPAMLHSPQQGAPTSRKQEDPPWKQEVQPVGIVLSEATWPGTEGRGGVVFCA